MAKYRTESSSRPKMKASRPVTMRESLFHNTVSRMPFLHRGVSLKERNNILIFQLELCLEHALLILTPVHPALFFFLKLVDLYFSLVIPRVLQAGK